MPVSGLGVAYSLSGFVLLWSGIRNASVKDTLTAFLKGTVPAQGPAQDLSIGVTDNSPGSNADASGAASGASVSDNSIAGDALHYAGHPYVYGGAPGVNGTSGWDCSSFVNWVLGHDLGFTLPGSTSPGYSGTSHGPNTLSLQ